jgi:hypothetical protein
MVMGNVDLQQIVHAPLEDEDKNKNIPTEAAAALSPIVRDVYGIPKLTPHAVTHMLRHLGIDGDNIHCVHEKKLDRKYVTRAGHKAVEQFIRTKPHEALAAFGSRAAKAKFAFDDSKRQGNRRLGNPEPGSEVGQIKHPTSP